MMSIESILLSGISAVTLALCFVAKLLWKEAEECKADRREIRSQNIHQQAEISKLMREVSGLSTYRDVIQRCPMPSCPFTNNPHEANNHH